jgi:hypothetical protein
VWVGQMHTELKKQTWPAIQCAGASAPPVCAAVPSGALKLWDYQHSLSAQEAASLRHVLLREITRNNLSSKASAPTARAAAAIGWDDSFAAVLLAQQQNIAALMGALKLHLSGSCSCADTLRLSAPWDWQVIEVQEAGAHAKQVVKCTGLCRRLMEGLWSCTSSGQLAAPSGATVLCQRRQTPVLAL